MEVKSNLTKTLYCLGDLNELEKRIHMNRKATILLGLLVTSTIIFLSFRFASPLAGTAIIVNPNKSYVQIGQTVTINVTVSDVTNLNTWQLRLRFNPSIINCTEITVPDENIFGSYFILFPPDINNAEGYVLVFCILDGTYGVNGSGNLVQVEFNSMNPGISSLEIVEPECPSELCDTYLQEPDYDFIPFEGLDGIVIVTDQGFEENLFTVIINEETYHVLVFSNSTITTFNYDQGSKRIMFDATGTIGTVGSTTAATPTFFLNGNVSVIMVLVDSTPTPYSLSRNATHDFIQFTYQHSTRNIKIFATIVGDINGDRKVRVDDVLIVALAFGSNEGDPDWNPYTDLDKDGKVRVNDVLAVAVEFGKEWTP